MKNLRNVKNILALFRVFSLNKMCRYFIYVIIIIIPVTAYGQDTLDLQYFLTAAVNASPQSRQPDITGESGDLRLRNINNALLPSAVVNAQANYNSETVSFGGALEGMPLSVPELPLDQYKAWVEISQVIYSGGAVSIQKDIVREAVKAEYGETEAVLYMLKQNVVQLYFAKVLNEKNISALTVTLDELNEKAEVLKAGVDNGSVLPDVLMSVKAEVLKIEQLITEAEHSGLKLVNNLSILAGEEIDPDAVFSEPAEPAFVSGEITRLELKVFDYNKNVLDLNKRLVTANDMPKVFAFTQLAYGRPGFDILSTDFHGFYTAGIGLKWDFINYGQSKREKRLIELQQDVINIKRDLFTDQLSILMDSELEDIRKYDSFLSTDAEIVKLRKSIAETGFVKLGNGVISTTDYLAQINSELLARLQMENHRILKTRAVYNYLFLQGKL